MTMLADLLSTVFERRMGLTTPWAKDTRTTEDLLLALVGTDGEISGRAIAQQLLERYDDMDDDGKRAFFGHITQAMDIDPSAVRDALSAYEKAPTRDTYAGFMAVAEPKRQELIRRLNRAPGATDKLVKMRADLLRLAKDDPNTLAFDLDFRHLFVSWFNRGFLVLRPINWSSPAHILEKIISYEAVHAIDSWDDLRRRVEPADRRCFAFFHPAMPDEPLIFVEVALTQGVAGSVQELLRQDLPQAVADSADTAVFYSISNCQAGLAGISFGNSLIKQVAADLALENPNLKTFMTLSPIPGFADWLRESRPGFDLTNDDEAKALAAYYLSKQKRNDGAPLDAVARFHLGNGALIHKVHAGADTSDKGVSQSHSVMVNYLYDLSKVAQNHERFAANYEISSSSEIRALSATAERLLAKETT